MSLSGRKQGQLIAAIAAEFEYDDLAALVRKIGVDLKNIVGPSRMDRVAHELIADMIETESLLILVVKLASVRKDRQLFSELVHQLLAASDVELNVRPASSDGLQRFVNDRGGFVFLKLVDRLAQSVCQIRYTTGAGKVYGGTGFLIAPDLVLTNYHVVELLIADEVDITDVALVFDHYLEADGISTNDGIRYALHEREPYLGYSKYNDHDLAYSDAPPDVPDNELDYALLQLEAPAGCEPISGDANTARGWIEIEKRPALPDEDDTLFIIQHPADETVTFAHEPNSIICNNPSGTRTRHKTATQDGSSGSPCFDGRYKLVGLHNGADPNHKRPAEYNQMVPLRAIKAHFEANDHWARIEQSIAAAPEPVLNTRVSLTGPDPHQTYVLPGKYPFLDRVELRTIAQHLNKSGDRLVTVNGRKNTGKTHTKKFLYHLAKQRAERRQDQFTPIWVDLARRKRGVSRSMTGLRLATEIVNQIPSLEFPDKYSTSFETKKEQDTTWAENVGSWLTGQLNDDPTIYWIIIDGYGEAMREPSVDYLLDDLIYRVSNTLDTVRLVLIDYEPTNFLDDDVGCHEDESRDLTDPENSKRLTKEIGKYLVEAHPPTFGDLQEQEEREKLKNEIKDVLAIIDPGRGGQMPELGKKMREKARVLQGGVT